MLIALKFSFENFLISTFQLLDRAVTARSNNWKIDIRKFSHWSPPPRSSISPGIRCYAHVISELHYSATRIGVRVRNFFTNAPLFRGVKFVNFSSFMEINNQAVNLLEINNQAVNLLEINNQAVNLWTDSHLLKVLGFGSVICFLIYSYAFGEYKNNVSANSRCSSV